ncbi:MAG: SRPBCC family protein [Burkholderiaceae bacterium]|nr:SRPBCC family protein [Burkholderiaceae bacterium]
MQQYPTHRSINTPLLIVAIGVGALLAYALSSPRRRTALVAAGQSALDAGSRLVSTSATRLRDMLPEPTQESIGRLSMSAEQAADGAMSSAAGKLHAAVDRASDLMHQAVTRARRLPGQARREAHEQWNDLHDTAHADGAGAPTARGVILAAAAVGAGMYALQRYGGSERLRHKIGADESGTISLERTLYINAPIEQVFDCWADHENFPRFMSNVKSVKPLGGDRSQWTVRGPAGIGVQFQSVAHMQRPSELAWESEPGSTVHNSGRVTLVPEGSGTRVAVRLAYRPPVGAMGQAVSSLLGANPKQEFEDDLERMKQFIEGRRIEASPAAQASSMSAAG